MRVFFSKVCIMRRFPRKLRLVTVGGTLTHYLQYRFTVLADASKEMLLAFQTKIMLSRPSNRMSIHSIHKAFTFDAESGASAACQLLRAPCSEVVFHCEPSSRKDQADAAVLQVTQSTSPDSARGRAVAIIGAAP